MSILNKLNFLCFISFLVTANPLLAEPIYKPSGNITSEKVIIFGPHPYSNPQDMYQDYEAIMRYLEKKIPGTKFKIETSKNYAEYESKLTGNRFNISLPNPYHTLLGIKNGYHVIAKMKPDDDFRGLIISRKDKHIRNAKDLIGKTLCFPSATAVAATMLPLEFLHDKKGIDIKNQININYVGSQYSTLLHAYSGDSVACGTTTRFWRTWSKENPDKALQMKILWKTHSLPHNSIIARNDMDFELANLITTALIGLDKDLNIDQKQFTKDQQHFENANNKTYIPVNDFLKKVDHIIGLPQSFNKDILN